jgi:D-lactate dehydrogenase
MAQHPMNASADGTADVLVFCDVAEWEAARFKRAFPKAQVRAFAEPVDRVPIDQLRGATVLSIFIHSRVTEEILARLPKLKLIATRSTGFDHVDLSACAQRGVVVCNVPHYGENTVAEFTFALMLALSRRVVDAVERTRRCDFGLEGLRGFDLRGKTLGVVGAGSIGLHVIRIARGFAMNVVAFDTRPQPLIAEVLDFSYVSLGDLLDRSDVVSLHVPGNPQTEHLLNWDRFQKMKRGSILINTARGSVVDTEALLRALNEGIVAGAGLDVVEGEEAIREESELLSQPCAAEARLRAVICQHALLRHPNVLVTPHVAFDTCEALDRIVETTIENIQAYLEGRPVNVVDKAFERAKDGAATT